MRDDRTFHVNLHIGISRRQLRAAAVLGVICLCVRDIEPETLTLTTSYPAPSGVYNLMITRGQTTLARDSGTVTVGPSTTLDRSGNILAPGTATVGAVSAGSVSVSGNVTAGGNVSGANLWAGDGIAGVNVTASNQVWAGNNVYAQNVMSTPGYVWATDHVTGYNYMSTNGVVWSNGVNGGNGWVSSNIGLWSNGGSGYNYFAGNSYHIGQVLNRYGWPSFIVNVGEDDCGWGHPYLGCPWAYYGAGSWHVGGDGVPGWCDGALRGVGFSNGNISAGWMVLCVAY